jgi:hypothetical protein
MHRITVWVHRFLGVVVRLFSSMFINVLPKLLRELLTSLPVCTVLLVGSSVAHAAGNSGATPPPSFVLDQCKRDVLAYQKNLEELRKAMGDKAAQEFADKFMTKEQWNESLLRDGYCAIARGLKAARLL